jgi:Cu/Ag efflux protein CusF
MTKRLSLGVVASLLVVALFAFAGFAQTDPRGRSYTLHGTVEGINDFAKSVRVNQEKIEGYSDARITTYNVDDSTMIEKLELGDKIVATIYEKDDILYDIRVVRIDDRIFPARKR